MPKVDRLFSLLPTVVLRNNSVRPAPAENSRIASGRIHPCNNATLSHGYAVSRYLVDFKVGQRQNQLEAELRKVQDHYAQEHAKEEAAADKTRREKCLRLGKEIYRDAARAERRVLLARGVYRAR